MTESAATSPVFHLHPGTVPLLVSIPHLGTHLPPDLQPSWSPAAQSLQDTDWHLDRLYAFARALGASVLSAKVSRYVIDLNRPPTGESLYPGQTTTGLCPLETFRGEALYRAGSEPGPAEIERRLQAYWHPYHQALQDELARLHQAHGGRVLLWEAHSIAGRLPRLFEGQLPDLNLGTHAGQACEPHVLSAVIEAAAAQAPSGLSLVANGRFKGGYITRHYGRPATGVQAIQLEMCQHLYMNESAPFNYQPERAASIEPVLAAMVRAGLQAVWGRQV